uniref:UspA domain-containing protein n=1 Tax=Araucaria cunninghamii TaxID=56994 RepID=A0A0D6R4E1_ARACU
MAETEGSPKERRVMVAVDESEESMYALSWALDFLCIGDEDTLVLLHAQLPPRVYTTVDDTGYLFSSDIMESMGRYQRSITENVLERAKRICTGKNVCVETRVAIGDARDVICEQAEQLQPDFLVIGSHGYGAIKRAFLGSVSDYCAHNVKCPVLIVKHPRNKTE